MKKRSSSQKSQKVTVKILGAQQRITIGMDLGDKTSRYCMLATRVRSCGRGKLQPLRLGLWKHLDP